VFRIALVVHAHGAHPNLLAHWALPIPLMPLICVMTSALGLVMGTLISPRCFCGEEVIRYVFRS